MTTNESTATMSAAAMHAGVERSAGGLLVGATARLSAAGVPSARLDAEVLLAHVLRTRRVALHTRPQQIVDKSALVAFETLLQRRAEREPLAYIIGTREFWSLELEVTPAVLIPRPETERVVELALGVLCGSRSSRAATSCFDKLSMSGASAHPELVEGWRGLSGSPSICEIGTGSGCIAVALARELAAAAIVATDVSPEALAVAQRNAMRHGVGGRIELVRSDLFAALQGRRFDVVVSNPPYVAAAEIAALELELRCEPEIALDGGADGLVVVRRLLAAAGRYLVPRGWLFVEIAATRADIVADLARELGFAAVDVVSDYAGLPRVLAARAG